MIFDYFLQRSLAESLVSSVSALKETEASNQWVIFLHFPVFNLFLSRFAPPLVYRV